MDLSSTMDKKNQSRPTPPLCKSLQDPSKASFDYSTKKNGPQYSRKREGNDKIDNGKRSYRGGRPGQRYGRPREKTGGQVEYQDLTSEIGSLQRSGSKKQNITHLFGWFLPGSDRHVNDYCHRSHRTRKHSTQSTKYKKEHYLQANCQFVVSSGHDYSLYRSDPDQLVDWELVEEVRLHMSEAPSCPICLYPPIAAKVTRCGHIFCFPCILHYLALTDHNSRKCPICFEEVSKFDLKSVITILHKDFVSNQEIELKLMRRDRDSLIPVPVASYSSSLTKDPVTLSSPDAIVSHSKLILASQNEISKYIVGREVEALKLQLEFEGDQPEACFIQEALTLVSQRESQLGSLSSLSEESVCFSSIEEGSPSDIDTVAKTMEKGLCIKENKSGIKKDQVFKDEKSPDDSPNICLEDLDIAQLQGNVAHANQDVKGMTKSTFYFYQESSGAHIYLHALNVHMLVREFGSLENCPQTIKAKVLEKESDSMTEALRQRLRYLRHLPVTCPFEVVQIEVVPPMISESTLSEFQNQLDNRERKRKKRAKEEHRIERRARDEEDRLMGRSKGAKINTNSFRHFPSFTEEVPTPPLTHEEPSATPVKDLATSDFPDLSPPSFAQMTRCGPKKMPNSPFPVLGETADRRPNMERSRRETTSKSNSDDDEEGERVPDYSTAFSDAFAKALVQVKMNPSSSTSDENAKQGKNGKKKKKKGILLLSSGGR